MPYSLAMGGGGARVGGRPAPSTGSYFFAIWWAFLLLFSIKGAFSLRFFPYWGPFSPYGVFLLLFFSVRGGLFCLYGGLFLGLSPPPTKISAGVHAFSNGFQGSPLVNSFQCILQYSRAIRTTVWRSLVCASHFISKSKIIKIKLFNYISACI